MRIPPLLLWALALSLGATACKATCPAPAVTLPPEVLAQPAGTSAAAGPARVKLGELAKASARTDKGPQDHNYVDLYERLILQWKNDPIKILEIGIEKGGSLLMWQDYFPKATIYGLDMEDKSALANARVTTLMGDQAKRGDLQRAMDISGGEIDILIDDGGHTMEQQQVSLGFLFKYVRPGGYYILEDLHTSIPALWKGYGVEPDGKNSTLRMIQDYMQSVPATFKSKYMLPEEMKYLNEHVEFANLHYRSARPSIVCIFKKK
jgi:demethylmacrocin O-methyltransferase